MVAAQGARFFGWREVVASLIVLSVYSACLYRMPTHTFWSPDEGCKLMQTNTIRWDGGIRYELPYGGEHIDPELSFYAGHMYGRVATALYPIQQIDGTFRFHWPMWFPLIVKVPVVLFGPTGGFLVAMLAGWLVAVLSGMLAAEIDRSLAAPAIMVTGLSTPVWFYSLCFWEHTIAVALALVAALILVRGDARLRALLLSLIPAIAAVMLRLELAAFIAALCATFIVIALQRTRFSSTRASGAAPTSLWTGRRLLAMIAVVALLVALVTVINFGMTARHWRMLSLFPTRIVQLDHLPTVLHRLTIPPASEWNLVRNFDPRLGFYALIAYLAVPFFRSRWIVAALTLCGLVLFAVDSGHLATSPKPYRTLHNLLPIAPFLILAAHGLRPAWQKRGSRFFIFALVTVLYLILSIVGFVIMYTHKDGNMSLGMGWGQRYLLTLYPLLSVLALVGLQAFWRSAQPRLVKLVVAGLAVLLLVIGFKFELRGYDSSKGTRGMLARWQRAMEHQGPIITDIFWLPAGLAEFYTHEPAFAVGWHDKVADWMREAASNGVTTFTFASLYRIDRDYFGNPPPRNLKRRSVRDAGGLYLTKFSFLAGTQHGPARPQPPNPLTPQPPSVAP